MPVGMAQMGKDKGSSEGLWDKTKRILFSSISENKARKKKAPKYGELGKGSKAYADAQEELEKEYEKDK
jgi:hypothetical protein